MQDPETKETIPTRLEGLLREKGIEKIVVAGLATDYCVKATAIDGVGAGFEVRLLTDGVRAVDLTPGDGERALEEAQKSGVVLV
jgi:nicotinamidase-related amidase